MSNSETFPDADSSFVDPGVSNGDVDWLFRGREVKKLTKKSNTINNEVQSQLLHAQQMILAQQKGKEMGSLTNSVPIQGNLAKSNSVELPLKSSMKSNLPRITTAFTPSSHESNVEMESIRSGVSENSDKSSLVQHSQQSPLPQAKSVEQTKSRSRSSSAVSNPFSKSRVPEIKPAKKSIFSTLSAKLKGSASPTSATKPSSLNSLTATSGKSIGAVNHSTSNSSLSSSENLSGKVRSISVDKQLTQNQLNLTKKKLDSVPFKRVNFALNDLIEDPQQQIPSRRPRRGNVLIPDDLIALPPKLSIGITNSFNEQTKNEKPAVDPRILEAATNRQNFFVQESKRHLEEAHLAAIRMAKEVSMFSKRRKSFTAMASSDDEEEEDVDSKIKTPDDLDIDTPIHTHINYFGIEDSGTDENKEIKTVDDITLETLYTRCCHLREILPIPATLKQLKNKHKPLHVLKMLNPKPTYIDILSFSDFLAIAQIITVIFDNVTIDNEMLNIVLISLKSSVVLNKLSLRNVPIEKNGWESLCKFLILNKSIQRLDLSQQKIKKIGDSKSVVRSELDWDLFVDALVMKGGIEELVIHGCTLNASQFDHLVKKALSLQTKRLGLASSQLDKNKMRTLADWISSKGNTCVGIDFGFNDLGNGEITPLIEVLKYKAEHVNLQFFSLNSTNIKLDECIEILKQLTKLQNLRFLDLGNNPHLFPGIIPTLLDVLPKYPDLKRLHFEFDDLSEVAIVQLCFIFQKCPKLVHVSLLGNHEISLKSSASVYGAVKNSNIYNLDLDYDAIDDEIVSKIAYYLMRNMERCLSNSNKDDKDGTGSFLTSDSGSKPGKSSLLEDLIFDGALLTKAAENLLGSKYMAMKDDERAMIYKSVIDKTIHLRSDIHNVMNKLFIRREMGKLTTEGKENLLRFCLLDDSLENILHIFKESVEKMDNKANDPEIPDVLKPSRPDMIRQLSAQLTRHLSSEDVINSGPILGGGYHQSVDDTIPEHGVEYPHQVVAEADRFVDGTTGMPVLMRNISQTYSNSKKLEEEEGEFHRWGFFVQQQNDIMPDDSQQQSKYKESATLVRKAVEEEQERIRIQKEQEDKLKEESHRRLTIGAIPSGPELRETIMKAKGIESINDLINKVNKDFSTVEDIYKHVDSNARRGSVEPLAKDLPKVPSSGELKDSRTTTVEDLGDEELSDIVSLNSIENYNNPLAADEMYDRILDNVVKVRSNR